MRKLFVLSSLNVFKNQLKEQINLQKQNIDSEVWPEWLFIRFGKNL